MKRGRAFAVDKCVHLHTQGGYNKYSLLLLGGILDILKNMWCCLSTLKQVRVFCDTFVVHDEIGHFVMNFVILLLYCEVVIHFKGYVIDFATLLVRSSACQRFFLYKCSLHFDSSTNFPWCPTFYLVPVAFEQSVNISGNRSKLDRKEKR